MPFNFLFENETFDFVLGTLCFHHIEMHRNDFVKTPLALDVICRVLKPSGFLIYYDRWNKNKVDEFFLNHEDTIRYTHELKAVYQKLK